MPALKRKLAIAPWISIGEQIYVRHCCTSCLSVNKQVCLCTRRRLIRTEGSKFWRLWGYRQPAALHLRIFCPEVCVCARVHFHFVHRFREPHLRAPLVFLHPQPQLLYAVLFLLRNLVALFTAGAVPQRSVQRFLLSPASL